MKNDNEQTKLARVLYYYNLIPDMTLKQKIVCPFHADVNPSLNIRLDEGIWSCFGCGVTGDAWTFTQMMESKYNGLNDLQAYKKYLKILKSKCCSKIHITPNSKARAKKHSRVQYVEAYDYFHGLCKGRWRYPEHMSDEQLRGLIYMQERGYTAKTLDMVDARFNEVNAHYKLLFPIMDNGKFKGWVSRTMDEEIAKKRKYLYNVGFERVNSCVGDYGIERTGKDYVFIVEGYMDRLRFVQQGINNVVAIFGWKIAQEQREKLLNAGVKYFISALDNDECGRKGTDYLQRVFGSDNVVRWRYLKCVKDAGDMDSELFKRMYNKTMLKYNEKILEKKGELNNGRIN